MVRSWDRCVGDANITAPVSSSSPTLKTFGSMSEADTCCFSGLLLNVHTNWHRCSVSDPHSPRTDPRISRRRSDELCWKPGVQWQPSVQWQPTDSFWEHARLFDIVQPFLNR